MSNKRINYHFLKLNLAVIFISTSGVLARYIDLPAPIIIFLRAFLAAILLFIYGKLKGFNFKIERKDRLSIIIGGVLMAIHWVTFFYALKISNVAIGMISLFTYPVFTTILEPLMFNTKIKLSNIIMGIIVLFGVYLMVPSLNFENDYFIGACFGVFSAVCYSIRNIMMKTKVVQYNQTVLMFMQLSVVSIVLAPTFVFFNIDGLLENLPASFLLALVTTAIGHTLLLSSFKHFSVASASIISSIQPIYGVILAIIFLNEYPSINTIWGGLIIISTVIFESLRIKNAKKYNRSIKNLFS